MGMTAVSSCEISHGTLHTFKKLCCSQNHTPRDNSSPGRYTAPYTGELMWPRTDAFNYEFACHEGNHSMGGMLRGARVLEQDWLEANGGGGKQASH